MRPRWEPFSHQGDYACLNPGQLRWQFYVVGSGSEESSLRCGFILPCYSEQVLRGYIPKPYVLELLLDFVGRGAGIFQLRESRDDDVPITTSLHRSLETDFIHC